MSGSVVEFFFGHCAHWKVGVLWVWSELFQWSGFEKATSSTRGWEWWQVRMSHHNPDHLFGRVVFQKGSFLCASISQVKCSHWRNETVFCAHVRPAAVFHPPIPHLECCGCGQSFFSEVVLKKLLHPESGDRLECLTTTLTTFLAVWFSKKGASFVHQIFMHIYLHLFIYQLQN